MVEIIPVAPEANVEAVRRQLAQGHSVQVALVLPDDWAELDNVARLRLVQRQAQVQRRHVALVTRHESTRKHAQQIGIPVFDVVEDAERRGWQMSPDLPRIDPRHPDQSLPEPPPWRRADIVRRQSRPSLHQARQRRIKAEARTRQPLPFWLRFTGYLAMAALLAVVLGGFVRYILPAATITLYPGRQPFSVSVQLTADGTLEEADLETNVLPARLVETTIEGSGGIATTGTQQKASDRAGGTVVFNNLGSTPVTIPLGTVLNTSTGTPISFRTTQEAQLDGGVGARVTVPIEALEPGIEGNVRANTINTVSGALRFRVRVINPNGTGGGGAQLVRVVTQQDKDNLLAQVQAALEQQAVAALQATLEPGEWLPPESVQTFIDTPAFDKFNDDEGDQLTLNLRMLAQGTALDQEQTNDAVLAALRNNVPPNGRLVADTVAMRREPGAVAIGRTVQFTMTGSAEYVIPIDAEAVKDAVAGKTPAEAMAIIAARWPLAQPPELYRDPDWLSTMPPIPNRIQVRVEYAADTTTP